MRDESFLAILSLHLHLAPEVCFSILSYVVQVRFATWKNSQATTQSPSQPANLQNLLRSKEFLPKAGCLSLQVRFATLGELTDHYTITKPASEISSTQMQVAETLRELVSSGRVIHDEDMYYPSFQRPGKYKMDLSGDVNLLRRPVVHALQQHPGIARADLDEHFIRDTKPAWYETWAFPK